MSTNPAMETKRGRGTVEPPPCHILTVSKRGVDVFAVANSDEAVSLNKLAGWELNDCEMATWSPCGTLLGLATDTGILLVDPSRDYAELGTLTTGYRCQKFYFSPKGTFLVALTPFVPTQNEKNVQVWDVLKRELATSFTLKGVAAQEKWPPLVWTSPNETYCFRLMPTELQVYDGLLQHNNNNNGDPLGAPASKFLVEKARTFSVSSEKDDGSVCVSLFSPPQGSMPARIQILKLQRPTATPELLNTKSFFQAQDIKMQWNKQCSAVLAAAYVDVDHSGKSYYGSSSLYFLEAAPQGASYQLVGPDKGPIGDFMWSPVANEFVLISGPVPPSVNLCDGRTGEPKLSFGQPRRNTIRFDPFGRFICLGGFGNLAGDLDVWDKNKKKIIGSAKVGCSRARSCSKTQAACTVDCEWSPDGRMILSTTTTPRMRVDNCVKIFRYNGELLTKMDFSDLYAAAWKPVRPGTYASRPASRDRLATAVIEKPNVYRPPQVAASRGPPRTSEFQTTATVIATKQNLPPGAEYATSKSKSAKRNAARRQKAKEAKAAAEV